MTQSTALLTTGNASLGKRKGQSVSQSLVDIFKRPFSRKSMTPPASPNCQLKQSKSKEDDVKVADSNDDVVVAVGSAAESGATELEEIGQNSELFPLPLPPTPSPTQGVVCMFSFRVHLSASCLRMSVNYIMHVMDRKQ